ncbi:uncharacterized protein [Mytilus edulis]|uniref:uncharacterized protein n=1 Tax=Mytilus edulis TaxID=6550 RepID=UPI0039EEC5A8
MYRVVVDLFQSCLPKMMCFQLIAVFSLSWWSLIKAGSPVNYKGMCAFSCNKQNRAYLREGTEGGDFTRFSSEDPTLLIATNNGTVKRINECYIRQGHFLALRQEIPGNDTHSLYACRKDAFYNPGNDIRILHMSPFKVFPNNPTLCDVCIGIDLQETRAMIEVGCNIPMVCPVTMKGQVQCTCEGLPKYDDGLCCDGSGGC